METYFAPNQTIRKASVAAELSEITKRLRKDALCGKRCRNYCFDISPTLGYENSVKSVQEEERGIRPVHDCGSRHTCT